MTIAELISALEEYPHDSTVMIDTNNWGNSNVKAVYSDQTSDKKIIVVIAID